METDALIPNTAVDIVVVLVILLSAVLAFVRGFIRESMSLGTWLLATWLAFTQYPLVAQHLEHQIANPNLRNAAAGLIIFAVVMLILVPIGIYIRSFIKNEHVNAVDRAFGFLFGAVRGFFILALLYLITIWLMPDERQPAWLKDAHTRPMLAYGAELIKKALPAEQREMMEKRPESGAENKAVSDELPSVGEAKDDLKKVMHDLKNGK